MSEDGSGHSWDGGVPEETRHQGKETVMVERVQGEDAREVERKVLLQAITPEVAGIDRDREIMVALIKAACTAACAEYSAGEQYPTEELREHATKFLRAWFDKKLMPEIR